eukprot:m.121111 g.121111  ORF g.121111 m.121111 type:complete len:212 (+) comp17267_c0_seq1:210-845(+)
MATPANVWTAYFDQQGRQYWHNAATGKSEWNRPTDIPADVSGPTQVAVSSTLPQDQQTQERYSKYQHAHRQPTTSESIASGKVGNAPSATSAADVSTAQSTGGAHVSTVRLGSGIPSSNNATRTPSTGSGAPQKHSGTPTTTVSAGLNHAVFTVFHDPKLIPAAKQLDAQARARVAMHRAQTAAYVAGLKTNAASAELAVAVHRAAVLADS